MGPSLIQHGRGLAFPSSKSLVARRWMAVQADQLAKEHHNRRLRHNTGCILHFRHFSEQGAKICTWPTRAVRQHLWPRREPAGPLDSPADSQAPIRVGLYALPAV